MTGIDVPGGMALECKLCAWRPAVVLPMGIVLAHFETEHDTDDVSLELVVVCGRCDKAMKHERSHSDRDIFVCEPCHRSRVIRRAAA